ncbi:MAG: 3-phosphoshikimate 1-carboxyvinyltransferase [Planctomycetia bacterium]|nr:3-phosphoshikimate 1-carboxyvinyltransferase [Planctomycetia bacterium]
MVESIAISPCGPIRATVRPPGSKSITNRALVCAALAEGRSTLTGALASDDTRVMIESLRRIGINVESRDDGTVLVVEGMGGKFAAPPAGIELFAGNSGTTVRFLTAMLTLGRGRFRIDGVPRMRQRPIEDLLDALRQLGANVRSELATGCPPVVVEAAGLPGGTATVRGDVSSQFLSAVLMAAPYARQPVVLRVDGPLVSQPYVRMTLRVMGAFSVRVDESNLQEIRVPLEKYQPRTYAIEPDASAASYFFAAAAITGGSVTVEGLSRDSLQGDVVFVNLLERMGCDVTYGANAITVEGGPLAGIVANMNALSDTVQTLAAVALFAVGPTTITGVAHIRHKETDRIAALATELRKLGAAVEERPDGLCITPGALRGATIATYDDHRMAMSLALVGLRVPGVVIENPSCVAKTYPRFFADLRSATRGA